MKRIIAILLCCLMLVPVFTACTGKDNNNSTDNTSNNNSNNNSGKNSGETPGIDAGNIKESDILSIAKKYYDAHSPVLKGELKGEFSGEVGAVSFDGKLKDDEKANELCNSAVVIAVFSGDGDYAVAIASAAVGWSSSYAQSAGTLASILLEAGFVKDGGRLNDAKKLAEYAISLEKDDINFYITLALILEEQNDIEGALKVINAGLAIDGKDNTALTIKIKLLTKLGVSVSGNDGPKLGNDLVESDGELSKRDREQENDTSGIEAPSSDDSKEEALKKLHELQKLEPITPADMLEKVFPEQAKEIRDKIKTVSEDDKKLGLIDFPLQYLQDLEAQYTQAGEPYRQFLLSKMAEAQKVEDEIRSGGTAKKYDGPSTPVDYMLDYNKEILDAAIENYMRFCKKAQQELLTNFVNPQSDTANKAADAAQKAFEAKAVAGALTEKSLTELMETTNNAIQSAVNAMLPHCRDYYEDVRREGELLWEWALPYARCTENPRASVARLFGMIHYYVDDAATNMGASLPLYFPGLAEMKREIEAALMEARKADAAKIPNIAEDDAIVFSFGPAKIKIKTTSVEAEVVAGLAARAKYDWGKDQMEAGIGVGKKWKIGNDGVEAKVYENVVFDLREWEIVDINVSASLSSSIMGTGRGVSAQYSFYGKGASLSSTYSQKIGENIGVEHKKTLFIK